MAELYSRMALEQRDRNAACSRRTHQSARKESHRGKQQSPASKCSPPSVATTLWSRRRHVSTRLGGLQALKDHTRTKGTNLRPPISLMTFKNHVVAVFQRRVPPKFDRGGHSYLSLIGQRRKYGLDGPIQDDLALVFGSQGQLGPLGHAHPRKGVVRYSLSLWRRCH